MVQDFKSIKSIKSIGGLIFPKFCIGCRKLGSEFCIKCEIELTYLATQDLKQGVVIYSGVKFSLVLSRIILAAKENNNLLARKILANCAISALSLLSKNGVLLGKKNIIFIPIPSKKSANRVRGIKHTVLLGQAIAKQWAEMQNQFLIRFESIPLKTKIEILDCLAHDRRIKDQSKLSSSQRRDNMDGAIKVDLRMLGEVRNLKQADSIIFILDDLVTTGSTVASAKAALNHAGIGVFGALASCSSQLKHALR